MRYVRCSRVRPGIISALNVTCISGLAQVRVGGSGRVFFFLNIGISISWPHFFLVLCLSLNNVAAIVLAVLESFRRGSRRLSNRLKDGLIVLFSSTGCHRVKIITDAIGGQVRDSGQGGGDLRLSERILTN